jgi:hypothetical protein
MDRAEIVSVTETFKSPAKEFKNCVKTKETTPLEADVGHKHYAPGVGLVQDAGLVLEAIREALSSCKLILEWGLGF